jgi:hypothetical protein
MSRMVKTPMPARRHFLSHRIDVAAGRTVGSVDVGVRVDPDEADASGSAAIELGNPSHGACGHRVIAAQDERHLPGFERLEHQFGVLGAGGGDFFQIFRVRIAFLLLFGDGHGDVAAVFHHVSQSFESASSRPRAPPTAPYRRRGAIAQDRAALRYADLTAGDDGGCGCGRHERFCNLVIL